MAVKNKVKLQLAKLKGEMKQLRSTAAQSQASIDKLQPQLKQARRSLLRNPEPKDDDHSAVETLEDKIEMRERKLAETKAKMRSLKIQMNKLSQQQDGPRFGKTQLSAEDSKTWGYKSFPQFLKDVRDFDRGHLDLSTNDKFRMALGKAKNIQMAAGSDEQSTQNAAFGGALIPPSYSTDIRKIEAENDWMAALCRRIQIEGFEQKFTLRKDYDKTGSVSGGIQVYRTVETQKKDPSRIQFEQFALTVHKLEASVFITEEMLENGMITFASYVRDAVGEEFAAKNIQERLNGNGVGKRRGILSSANTAKIEVPRNTTSRIKGIDILNMKTRCWGYENAIWIANQDSVVDIETSHIVSDGNAGVITQLYRDSLTSDAPPTLKGRPLYYSSYAPTLTEAGALILVNLREYYEGFKYEMRQQESIHVRFLEGETCFRFTSYNGGRPAWDEVLTPTKGTTKSPFVSLKVATS